jgi:sugar/nucleoside kinase (ribokinase family)
MRKLNAQEGAKLLGEGPGDYMGTDELVRLSGQLFQRWNAPIALTAGDRGSVASTQEGATLVEAVPLGGRLDPVGAGDAFLAGLAGGLAGNLGFVEAARLGSLAAAVTVRKLQQPGTASPGEILALAAGIARP